MAVDIFSDAARTQHGIDAAEIRDRIGQPQGIGIGRPRAVQHRREIVRHDGRDAMALGGRDGFAQAPVQSRMARVQNGGLVEARDAVLPIDHKLAAADGERSYGGDASVVADRQLGGAAADVDVQNARLLLARDAHRARAVGGEHRLHVVACGGADEFAALLR